VPGSGSIGAMPARPSVASLHIYPVKSMAGQDVPSVRLDQRGCVGDRMWAVRTVDGKIGSGKDTRRFANVAGLLLIRAETDSEGVSVVFPDGRVCRVDNSDSAERLSACLERPLSFTREDAISHFDDGAVSVLGTASVRAVEAELGAPVHLSRYRPNIVVNTDQPFIEECWIGKRIGIGTALLEVTLSSPRCVMVNAATSALPPLPGHLAAIGRVNKANLGIVARVLEAGVIETGDPVRVL
jgi:uncharacterized protein YcbX